MKPLAVAAAASVPIILFARAAAADFGLSTFGGMVVAGALGAAVGLVYAAWEAAE